jgi:hypothetical protein
MFIFQTCEACPPKIGPKKPSSLERRKQISYKFDRVKESLDGISNSILKLPLKEMTREDVGIVQMESSLFLKKMNELTVILMNFMDPEISQKEEKEEKPKFDQ